MFETSYANIKVFFDDIYQIVNAQISKIEKEEERKRNEELLIGREHGGYYHFDLS